MKTNLIFNQFILAVMILLCASGEVFANAFDDAKMAERQTTFNNVTDYFATVGKDASDKKEILRERRNLRRKARLENEARKKKQLTKKKMKAQKEAIMNKLQAEGY